MKNSGGFFDVAAKGQRVEELDGLMAESGFWDDQDRARGVIKEANQLKGWTEPFAGLEKKAADLGELAELLEVDEDEDLEAEWLREQARS